MYIFSLQLGEMWQNKEQKMKKMFKRWTRKQNMGETT